MNKLVTTFALERETKGTYRYNEEGSYEVHVVGALYVKKAAAGSNPPRRIQVTIEELPS